jgi:hemolysin activation/secretion protein
MTRGVTTLICRRTFAGVALLLQLAPAIAADSIDHLNVPPIGRPDFIPPKPGETFQLPPVETPAPVTPAPEGAAALRVDQVEFRGNTVIPTAELQAIAAPYVGREVNAAELEELRQRLTRLYIDRGYINSGVLISPQSSGQTLVFDVVEGRLTGVRLRGMERLREGYVTRRLARDSDGPLNIEVLRERFQLLLSDPLFERMNGRLVPGERAGEAHFDVDVERARPYQLSAFFNNYRPPSIGSKAVGLSGWLRNVTGFGDLLEATVQDSTEGSSSVRTNIAWRIPLGYAGTQLYLAYDDGRSSVIEQPSDVLNITSTLRSREVGLSHPFIESLRHRLALGLNRVSRENRSFLLETPFSFNPGEPSGVTKELLWRFWQEYTYRSEVDVAALRSTFTSGRNNVVETAAPPGFVIPPQRFQIWLGQAQYVRQVMDNGAQAIVRVTAQRTHDRLLPIDGISIGGVYTVRGYRENQLVRDEGTIVNLELEYPLLRAAGRGLNLTVIPFYDRGRGWNRGEGADTISSWGLANRLRWKGLSIDLVLAKRLVSPELPRPVKETLQDEGVHFQIAYAFF